jgi:hypothetical protein
MIGDMVIESEKRKIKELRMKSGYSWCSDVPMSTPVQSYGAVMSRNHVLVNIDSYIAFKNEEEEEKVLLD